MSGISIGASFAGAVQQEGYSQPQAMAMNRVDFPDDVDPEFAQDMLPHIVGHRGEKLNAAGITSNSTLKVKLGKLGTEEKSYISVVGSTVLRASHGARLAQHLIDDAYNLLKRKPSTSSYRDDRTRKKYSEYSKQKQYESRQPKTPIQTNRKPVDSKYGPLSASTNRNSFELKQENLPISQSNRKEHSSTREETPIARQMGNQPRVAFTQPPQSTRRNTKNAPANAPIPSSATSLKNHSSSQNQPAKTASNDSINQNSKNEQKSNEKSPAKPALVQKIFSKEPCIKMEQLEVPIQSPEHCNSLSATRAKASISSSSQNDLSLLLNLPSPSTHGDRSPSRIATIKEETKAETPPTSPTKSPTNPVDSSNVESKKRKSNSPPPEAAEHVKPQKPKKQPSPLLPPETTEPKKQPARLLQPETTEPKKQPAPLLQPKTTEPKKQPAPLLQPETTEPKKQPAPLLQPETTEPPRSISTWCSEISKTALEFKASVISLRSIGKRYGNAKRLRDEASERVDLLCAIRKLAIRVEIPPILPTTTNRELKAILQKLRLIAPNPGMPRFFHDIVPWHPIWQKLDHPFEFLSAMPDMKHKTVDALQLFLRTNESLERLSSVHDTLVNDANEAVDSDLFMLTALRLCYVLRQIVLHHATCKELGRRQLVLDTLPNTENSEWMYDPWKHQLNELLPYQIQKTSNPLVHTTCDYYPFLIPIVFGFKGWVEPVEKKYHDLERITLEAEGWEDAVRPLLASCDVPAEILYKRERKLRPVLCALYATRSKIQLCEWIRLLEKHPELVGLSYEDLNTQILRLPGCSTIPTPLTETQAPKVDSLQDLAVLAHKYASRIITHDV